MADMPIQIVVDDREKKPWQFNPEHFNVVRKRIPVGDYAIRTTGYYSIMGIEDQVILERKSLGDFVGTVIHNWLRFRKELWQLASVSYAAIVIEASVDDCLRKQYESDAMPQSVMGRAAEITIDHGIPVLWWGPRPGCVQLAEQYLRLVHTRCKP